MRYLFILLLLSGCATKSPIVPIETPKKIRIDSSLLKECPPLKEATSEADLFTVIIENIEIYSICRDMQRTSIKVIKELTNND